MTLRRLARRLVGAIVHNWPLKLAALVLATLLYIGLVATQGSATYPGPIPVTAVNVPTGTIVTNQLRTIDEVRYIAPADLGRLTADDFHATVDLSNLQATGTPQSVRVVVTVSDPRVTILEVRPRTITVVLDQEVSNSVPVTVVRSTAPPGIEVGDTTYTPQMVKITGPSTAVKRAVSVRVDVSLDPNGLDYDQEVQGTPVDASGAQVSGVTLDPRTVHVTIPLYKNKQSRNVPINPVLTGEPAPGFRVSGVDVTPLTVTLEGEADTLAKLGAADTAPVAIFGATRNITATVAFSLPTGVTPLSAATVQVVVRISPVTETRTFTAGLRLDGTDPALTYDLATQSVLLTVYGSTADLDLLGSNAITVGIDVSGMGPGRHQVTVVPTLPSGVSVVTIAPQTVTVVITAPSPSPSSSDAPPSGDVPSPTPAPS
jgi:YbbR domain-containing protein